jgi:D-alanine-D-alanine ligase
MSIKFALHPSIPLDHLKVWVLAPYIQTNEENIDYFYDFSQSIAEYTRTFAELKIEWQWQPVTLQDYQTVIAAIEADRLQHLPIVLNLCDGDEINGTPGISVVRLLKEKGLIYTGADADFYEITTSKIPMKQAFEQYGVATPDWEIIEESNPVPAGIFERLGTPIIIKPAVSGGSMGVGIRSVVDNAESMAQQVALLYKGYRGWQLTGGGVIAEKFIEGPEYTAFMIGSSTHRENCTVYTPVERVFHASLPEKEKFLSFDRLWEIYEEESAMPNDGNFYEYELPDASQIEAIKQLSWLAYQATGGTGYTRADIRMDSTSGTLYVLEVNAQCGISEDENFTSIGAILRLSGKSFTELVVEIINDAFMRTKQ